MPMWSRVPPSRVMMVGVITLILLLVLHHPLMGAMATATPTHEATASETAHNFAATSSAFLASGHGRSVCPTCEVACPLVQCYVPDRETLLSASNAAWPSAVSATPIDTLAPCARASRAALTPGAAAIPSAQTRRALLRVFLL